MTKRPRDNSPWTSFSVNLLREKVGHTLIKDYFMDRVGSYLSCEHTNETFGIVKVSPPIMNSYRILSNGEITVQYPRFSMDALLILAALPLVTLPIINHSATKFAYKHLSNCQGTKFAVTAVHTKEEIILFKALLDTQGEPSTKVFSPFDANHPDFFLFATTWNLLYCNVENNIYYKTPEHIRSYYNILEDRKKDVRSVVENVARFEVEEIPTNPQRSLPSAPDISQFVAPLRVLLTPPRTFPRIMPVALPSSSREFVRERTLASHSGEQFFIAIQLIFTIYKN
ncbi:unnamed protein product [Mucor hiemalis]